MALLHFANLVDHRPDVLRDRAARVLDPYNRYLAAAIKHLQSEAAAPLAGWREVEQAPEGATWVELLEPDGATRDIEVSLRPFFEDEVREVEERATAHRDGAGARAKVPAGREMRIAILEQDPELNRLLLERKPATSFIRVRPNTYALDRQHWAMRLLRQSPAVEHRPLLRLVERADHAAWPSFVATDRVETWHLLKDESGEATPAQRQFVELALATPDFAILEGPPGSGKTTAICELVIQLAARRKRVLLCASTHVAVDNVLERLGSYRELVTPVRIGDRKNVSEAARVHQLGTFVSTVHRDLRRFLETRAARSAAQETMLAAVRSGDTVETLVLDSANLVAGTTIGILQHPAIKTGSRRGVVPEFDVLILDEASKTTFQEFLVPALHARRWIIVGDPKQLSPYVDDQALAANLAAAVPLAAVREACADVFAATRARQRRRTVVVETSDPSAERAYVEQGTARGAVIATSAGPDLAFADLVVAPPASLLALMDTAPLDAELIRGGAAGSRFARRAAAWRRRGGGDGADGAEPFQWENEVAWRICRRFEQRMQRGATEMRLSDEIDALLPVNGLGPGAEGLRGQIRDMQRVALPSVLEVIQMGYAVGEDGTDPCALASGLPPAALRERHVLLEFQQRMHPELSVFSREQMYEGRALKDGSRMAGRRTWNYPGYAHRTTWIDVRGTVHAGGNQAEVAVIAEELQRFLLWAVENPRAGGGPWELAVLSFYRGQEHALREVLRKLPSQSQAYRHFRVQAAANLCAIVELCTVDRYQGHEADVVFLSFANDHATSFLESPNRLNVALTRARYQRVIVGDRRAMSRSRSPVLRALAETEPAEQRFGGGT